MVDGRVQRDYTEGVRLQIFLAQGLVWYRVDIESVARRDLKKSG
jgi:hypothetical protein